MILIQRGTICPGPDAQVMADHETAFFAAIPPRKQIRQSLTVLNLLSHLDALDYITEPDRFDGRFVAPLINLPYDDDLFFLLQ